MTALTRARWGLGPLWVLVPFWTRLTHRSGYRVDSYPCAGPRQRTQGLLPFIENHITGLYEAVRSDAQFNLQPLVRHRMALGVGVVLATVALLLASALPTLVYGAADFQAWYVRSAGAQGTTDGWLFLRINNTGFLSAHYLFVVVPVGAERNGATGQPITVMPGSSFGFSMGVDSNSTQPVYLQVSVYRGGVSSPSALVFSKVVEAV